MTDDYTLLYTCHDSTEAAMLKSMLEAEGIACVVQGENHRAMLGIMGAYIELRVLVPAAELEKAREFLTADADETGDDELSQVDVLMKARRRRNRGLFLIAVLVGPGLLYVLVGLWEKWTAP